MIYSIVPIKIIGEYKMAKKSKAIAITKNNIQEAFWSFYKEMPMDKIRINAVMERAGYNRGTFYEYFKSLDEVLESIEQKIRNDFIEQIQFLLSGELRGADILLGAVQIVMANKEKFSVLLGKNGDSKFREILIEGTSSVIEVYFRDVLEIDFDLVSNDKFRYFVHFVSTGLWGTIVKWANETDEKSINVEETLEYFEQVSILSNDFCTKMIQLG